MILVVLLFGICAAEGSGWGYADAVVVVEREAGVEAARRECVWGLEVLDFSCRGARQHSSLTVHDIENSCFPAPYLCASPAHSLPSSYWHGLRVGRLHAPPSLHVAWLPLPVFF